MYWYGASLRNKARNYIVGVLDSWTNLIRSWDFHLSTAACLFIETICHNDAAFILHICTLRWHGRNEKKKTKTHISTHANTLEKKKRLLSLNCCHVFCCCCCYFVCQNDNRVTNAQNFQRISGEWRKKHTWKPLIEIKCLKIPKSHFKWTIQIAFVACLIHSLHFVHIKQFNTTIHK